MHQILSSPKRERPGARPQRLRLRRVTCVGAIVAVAVLYGCSDDKVAQEVATAIPQAGAVAEIVKGDIDSLPKLRFADGMVSLNDRCMVRKVPLNPKMPPVYVSGHPVGFC